MAKQKLVGHKGEEKPARQNNISRMMAAMEGTGGVAPPPMLQRLPALREPAPAFGRRANKGASTPGKEKALQLEKEGRHLDAGLAFREAARKVLRKDGEKAAGLAEKAARNFTLAGNHEEAVSACRMVIGKISWDHAKEMLGRLIRFCDEEAGKAEAADPARAANILKVALTLSDPIDFNKVEALSLRIRLLESNAGRKNLIGAMMESVHTPPEGDAQQEHFSTSTPWLVPAPKPTRK